MHPSSARGQPTAVRDHSDRDDGVCEMMATTIKIKDRYFDENQFAELILYDSEQQ